MLKISKGRLIFKNLNEPMIRVAGFLFSFLGKNSEGVELYLRGFLLAGKHGLKVGRSVHFIGDLKSFSFGANVCLYGNTVLNATGSHGNISIGKDTHIDHNCVLYGQGGLVIGKECAIAAGTLIYSQTNKDIKKDGTPVALQPTYYSKVTVSDGCWLGAGVVVLPGVALGDSVQVGAGAVVTKSVDNYTVIAGVPAKPMSNV